ncbi:MAG: hypothetical protein H6706_24055 [Myxococcales bacterium]|nr:hypothetical protein [Myxococcales bacterium]
MNLLKPFFGTVILGSLLFGCGKNEAVVAAEQMAEAVCACKDMACAQKASQEQAEKLMKFKDKKGTEADVEAIKKAGEKTAECLKNIIKDSVKIEKPAMKAPETAAAPATAAAAPETAAAEPAEAPKAAEPTEAEEEGGE